MKNLAIVLLPLLVMGCQSLDTKPQPLVYGGGDGSSCQQAVVVKNVRVRETGKLAERVWLDHRYPGCKQNRQSVTTQASRRYELVEFTTMDGQSGKVYFDVTEFDR